jgi:hypothetical protein
MRLPRLAALAAALALSAMPAVAADCRVNFVASNYNTVPVHVFIESRTRANRTFRAATTALAAPIRGTMPGGMGRSWRLEPGETVRGVITFPLVGCSVERQIRYIYHCDRSERVFNLNGGAFVRPTDLTFVPTC